jgi:hypothetical protein
VLDRPNPQSRSQAAASRHGIGPVCSAGHCLRGRWRQSWVSRSCPTTPPAHPRLRSICSSRGP